MQGIFVGKLSREREWLENGMFPKGENNTATLTPTPTLTFARQTMINISAAHISTTSNLDKWKLRRVRVKEEKVELESAKLGKSLGGWEEIYMRAPLARRK